MARDPSFSPPLSELAKSGIGVAAAPTGGLGLALDQNGKLPNGLLSDGYITSAMIQDGTISPGDVAAGTFLQLVTGGTVRKVKFGSAVMTFSGGTPVGGVVTAAHGLGVTPLAYIALAGITNIGGFAVAAYANGSDATNITIGGYAQGGNPAGGDTSNIYWLAIG